MNFITDNGFFNNNMEKVFNNEEFVDILISQIDKKYDISDFIKLLKELKPGGEKNWIEMIDDKLNHFSNEIFEEHIDEWEEFKDMVVFYSSLLIEYPRAIHMFKLASIFLLEILIDAKIYNLSELHKKEEDKFFKFIFGRICKTVVFIVISIMISQSQSFFAYKDITFLNWTQSLDARVDGDGRKCYDKIAWIEFNEFLNKNSEDIQKRDIPTKSSNFGGCIVM